MLLRVPPGAWLRPCPGDQQAVKPRPQGARRLRAASARLLPKDGDRLATLRPVRGSGAG